MSGLSPEDFRRNYLKTIEAKISEYDRSHNNELFNISNEQFITEVINKITDIWNEKIKTLDDAEVKYVSLPQGSTYNRKGMKVIESIYLKTVSKVGDTRQKILLIL